MKLHTIFGIFSMLFSSFLGAEESSRNSVGNPFKWLQLNANALRAIQQQDFDEALNWAEKAYDYARQHTHDSYAIRASAGVKGLVLANKALIAYQDDSKKGLELTEKYRELTRKHFGGKHPLTAVPGFNIMLGLSKKHNVFSLLDWTEFSVRALLAFQQEDSDEALKWAEKSYDSARRYFNNDYQERLTISATLKMSALSMKALESYQNGNYRQELDFSKNAHDFTRQYFGRKHEYTFATTVGLSLSYANQGDYENAEYWLKQALALSQELFDKNHLHNIGIFSHLGNFYRHQGDYGQAESYYKQALKLSKQNEVPGRLIWKILNRLGALYLVQERYEEAYSAYQEAYSFLKKLLSSDVPAYQPQNSDAFEMSFNQIVDATKY
ncbi:MAG: hypothetical protein DRR19_25810, partial [Candidatus Parabeggiatoa sp. nov. 1]